MIKYLLKCKNKHEFESWFSTSKEYEKLKNKKLIDCIFCKSKKIEKSIMSPNIVGKNFFLNNKFENKKFIRIKKDLKKMQKFVQKNFEFVGDRFAREVREIYYDKKKKNIYGTVSSKKREELQDEGIGVISIPWVDGKEN